MKIKDITEGLYDYLSGIKQQKTQAKWSAGGPEKEKYMANYEKELGNINQAYHQQIDKNPDTTPEKEISTPPEGAVLLVQAPNGEQYFKSYKGTWHLKSKPPTDYSVGGTKITAPKDIAILDKLLSKAKLIGVKSDPHIPDSWVYDDRKTKILAKRGVK